MTCLKNGGVHRKFQHINAQKLEGPGAESLRLLLIFFGCCTKVFVVALAAALMAVDFGKGFVIFWSFSCDIYLIMGGSYFKWEVLEIGNDI